MKNLIYYLFLLMPMFCFGQNHVINGNFEQYSLCPDNFSQLNRCDGWFSFINGTTPDFFHTCASGTFAGVPTNRLGYQQPASGNGYLGLIAYTAPSVWREVPVGVMTPLTPGVPYEVSLSVSRADTGKWGSDNITVFFYDSIAGIYMNNFFPIKPQVNFKSHGVISESTNWVRLAAAFVADSAYDRIAIGGFLPDSMVQTQTYYSGFPQNSPHLNAYYYIDSVVVRQIEAIYITNCSDTSMCVGDSMEVSFSIYGNFSSNNIFTAQLSDASGSFNSPINIGTLSGSAAGTIKCGIPKKTLSGSGYQVRIISSAFADTSLPYHITLDIGNLDSTHVSFGVNSPLCESSTLAFTTTVSDSYPTFQWSGPNNFSSNSATPSITNVSNTNAGTYIVKSDLFGCLQSDTLSVVVKPLPVNPTASNNSPICAQDSIKLSGNSSSPGVTYTWVGPNSFSSNDANPSIQTATSAKAGIYTIFAMLNGCIKSDTTLVTVKPLPDTVSASSSSPLCSGKPLYLYGDTSRGSVTYSWKGPNNFTASTHNAGINSAGVSNTGWYYYTVDRNGCYAKDSLYLNINATPAKPTISFSNPICVGETLLLNASGAATNTYSWVGPGGYTSNIKSPVRSSITTADTGIYHVATTANGCTSDTDTVHINVNPLPFSVITSNPSDTACVGEAVAFTSLPGNAGSNLQYKWFVNGQQQAATGQTFTTTTLNTQDIVFCEMTDNTKCSTPYTDESNHLSMTILPWLTPTVSISVNPPGLVKQGVYLTFTALTTNAGNKPTYQWKRNGADILGAQAKTWSANSLNNADVIHVVVTSSYRCPQPDTAVSNSIETQIATGIKEIAGLSDLTIAPNPNSGRFVLSGQLNYNGIAHISVMNMLGQTIYKTDTKIINDQLYQEVVLSNISGGIYLLQLEIDGQKTSIRFNVD